jgi:hypothetical protein
MGRRSKALVAIACAVALVGAIALLALLRTDDGREVEAVQGRREAVGRAVASTSPGGSTWRWVCHWECGSTSGFAAYTISDRRSSRWSSRKVSASADVFGANKIQRVRLMAGVDRNGDGHIEHAEWTQIALVECTEGTKPARLTTPEIEVAEDGVACWIRIEGEPFGSYDASMYDDGFEVEMK